MKQMDVIEKTIGENIFYIKPLPAFVASNISGELAGVLTPLIGSLAPLLSDFKVGDKGVAAIGDIMDMEVEKVAPSLTTALSGLSGDKIESLMKKLLINHKNIAVSVEGQAQLLTYDLANEIFCGEIQDMYILCFEVIKINFKGFFKRLGGQSGNLQKIAQALMKTPSDSTANGESLT